MLQQDLTTGNITSKLWMFALPLMLGNVMQQFYNLADTWDRMRWQRWESKGLQRRRPFPSIYREWD